MCILPHLLTSLSIIILELTRLFVQKPDYIPDITRFRKYYITTCQIRAKIRGHCTTIQSFYIPGLSDMFQKRGICLLFCGFFLYCSP